MDKIKTGNMIREARTRKGYTQSELGALIGVSNKAVSRWENWQRKRDVQRQQFRIILKATVFLEE